MTLKEKFQNRPKIFHRLKVIGCGCLVILLLIIALLIIFSGIIIKKLVSGTIHEQTGVVQTVPNNGQGRSYTDPKTGATINLGVNKIPDSFPKDFPVYPGATVTTSETGTGNGFWLTLVTNDGVNTVSAYYQNALTANGWTAIQASTTSSSGISWAVSKGNLSGYLTIDLSTPASGQTGRTSVLVVLGEVAR